MQVMNTKITESVKSSSRQATISVQSKMFVQLYESNAIRGFSKFDFTWLARLIRQADILIGSSMNRVATCQGNVREKRNFLQVREKSGNFEKCQGILAIWSLSGNFVMTIFFQIELMLG